MAENNFECRMRGINVVAQRALAAVAVAGTGWVFIDGFGRFFDQCKLGSR